MKAAKAPKAPKDLSDAISASGGLKVLAAVKGAPLSPAKTLLPKLAVGRGAKSPDLLTGEGTAADAAAQLLDALDHATVSAAELRGMKLPQRKKLLGEWFAEGDLGFIYAPRGAGKTWFALDMARAIAEGGAMGEWPAAEPAGVLYVDGEMPPDLIRDRENGLARGEGSERLFILNHAVLFDRTERALNIARPETQSAITELCQRRGVRVLFLDNLSTLAAGMKENEADEWEKVNNWLLMLRRRGVAVVIVHHAGRNGQMRGTSRREDAAFWVVSLTGDQATESGARFTSTFTKRSRNTALGVPAMAWHYTTDADTGRVNVACRRADPLATLRQLVADGVTTCADLAEEMGVSKATVSKMAKRAGLVKGRGREYALPAEAAEGSADGNERGIK